MYKRVSTALQSPAFRLSVSAVAMAMITLAFYHNWSLLRDAISTRYYTIALVLMIVFPLTWLNLYCEVRKWFTLLGAKNMSIQNGLLQILSGMCSGFITPNRLGEFAGRMTFLPSHYHKSAPVIAFSGSAVQASITAIFGIAGIVMFPVFPSEFTSFKFLGIAGVLFIALAMFAYLFRGKLKEIRTRLWSAYAHMRHMERKVISMAFLWALLRYLVFSTQFVIVLYFLGFSGPLHVAFGGVFLLYFCQSFIPGPAMGELGIRELLAMFIFGAFLPHPALAALAGLLVWLCNIGLPVLAGASIMGFSIRHEKR